MPDQLPFSPIKDDILRSQLTLGFLNDKFPGVDSLVEHSTNNVKNGTFVDDEQGFSTISSMTVGIEGREFGEKDKGLRTFLVPTIFDGKRLSGRAAKARAIKLLRKGVVFPSVAGDNHKELDEIASIISSNLKNVNGMLINANMGSNQNL